MHLQARGISEVNIIAYDHLYFVRGMKYTIS